MSVSPPWSPWQTIASANHGCPLFNGRSVVPVATSLLLVYSTLMEGCIWPVLGGRKTSYEQTVSLCTRRKDEAYALEPADCNSRETLPSLSTTSVDRGERSHFPTTLYSSKTTGARKLRFGTRMQLVLRQIRTNLCAGTFSGSPLNRKTCAIGWWTSIGVKKRTFGVENRTVLYFKTNGGISTKFCMHLR